MLFYLLSNRNAWLVVFMPLDVFGRDGLLNTESLFSFDYWFGIYGVHFESTTKTISLSGLTEPSR